MMYNTKLTHIDHVDDLPLIHGMDGINIALDLLDQCWSTLLNDGKEQVYISEKMDGSPSFVIGNVKYDPLTGEEFDNYRIFVSTKGIFNKTKPYVFYDEKSLVNHFGAGPLAYSLTDIMTYVGPHVEKNGIYQGDLMYSLDTPYNIFGGTIYINPNPSGVTLVLPQRNEMGLDLDMGRIGVAIHTEYSGGILISDMTPSPKVMQGNWYRDNQDTAFETYFFDPYRNDVDFGALQSETYSYGMLRSAIRKTIVAYIEDIMRSGAVDVLRIEGSNLKDFVNSCVRHGIKPSIDAYKAYIVAIVNAKVYTSSKRQLEREKRTQEQLEYVNTNTVAISAIFKLLSAINDYKALITSILNNNSSNLYILAGKKSGPEGYVIWSQQYGYTKLVDRQVGGFAQLNQINRGTV